MSALSSRAKSPPCSEFESYSVRAFPPPSETPQWCLCACVLVCSVRSVSVCVFHSDDPEARSKAARPWKPPERLGARWLAAQLSRRRRRAGGGRRAPTRTRPAGRDAASPARACPAGRGRARYVYMSPTVAPEMGFSAAFRCAHIRTNTMVSLRFPWIEVLTGRLV